VNEPEASESKYPQLCSVPSCSRFAVYFTFGLVSKRLCQKHLDEEVQQRAKQRQTSEEKKNA